MSIGVVGAEVGHGLLVFVHVEVCTFAEIVIIGLLVTHLYYLELIL
jgi:hypothetical protein